MDTVTKPTFVENAAKTVLVNIQTGDCALVRGVMLGLDDDIVAHASAKRDARIAALKAYYLAQ